MHTNLHHHMRINSDAFPHPHPWRQREDSYTTELDQGGEEKFERIVIYAPLLTLMLRLYLGGERLWRLMGHRVDPHFRRLVSVASVEQPAASVGPTVTPKRRGGSGGMIAIAAAVAAGAGVGWWLWSSGSLDGKR